MSSETKSYSDLAGSYNQKRFTSAGGQFLFEIDRSIILDFVALSKPQIVIDIPVGTGRSLEYLKAVDCQAIGFDYTQEMLDEARKVMDNERHQLQQGNASDTGFADGKFDCLISLRFFHLFAKNERAPFAREFRRITRPGGHAIISFTNGWYAGGINWMKRLLGINTVEFIYPQEISQLFPGWEIIAVRGNFLPKQWRLDAIPVIGSLLRTLNQHTPFNRLCWEVFYLLQKPKA